MTGEICFDKEIGNVGQSFEVRFDIGEVAVVAIELSKEEECSRRRTMGRTPHPTATNNITDLCANCDRRTKLSRDIQYDTLKMIGCRPLQRDAP